MWKYTEVQLAQERLLALGSLQHEHNNNVSITSCWRNDTVIITHVLNGLNSGIEKMWAIIRDAISHRRKNPAPPGEHLLIDALLQSDHSDDVIFADLLVFAVGAYYTVAYGKHTCQVTLDISGSPIESQSGSRKYTG